MMIKEYTHCPRLVQALILFINLSVMSTLVCSLGTFRGLTLPKHLLIFMACDDSPLTFLAVILVSRN